MAYVEYKPHYRTFNGIIYPTMFSTEYFKEAMNYKPKIGDVFIVTYPKCGTTWMQNIVTYIFRKGKELDNIKDWCRISPYIDAVGNQGISLMPRPGAFKTHLPFSVIPYSPDAKYINVYRNPKDCCVSLYYYTKLNIGFGYWESKFDDFFDLFLAGQVMYNDYCDHLMSWYPHRNDSNVFFTTYEDMKKDTKDIILKLARFLGKEYIDAIEKDNNVLRNILNFSSFEYMKKNLSEQYDLSILTEEQLNDSNLLDGYRHIAKYGRSLNPPPREKLHFIRKGIVGDWKNHFSEEQSKIMNKKFLERTQGTEIQEKYHNYM